MNAQMNNDKKQKKANKSLKKKVNRDVAKAIGGKKRGKLGDWLLKNNQYFLTLIDPFKYRSVQIPDPCNYPSTCFTVVDKRQVTVNTNGVAFVVYGMAGNKGSTPYGALVPHLSNGTLAGGTLEANFTAGMYSNPNAVTLPQVGDLFPSGGTYPGTSSWNGFQFKQWGTSTYTPTSTTGAVQGLYQKVRLVSAGFTIDYLGTSYDAAGSITVATAPRNSVIKNKLNNAVTVQLDDIQSLPDMEIIPVSRLAGGTALYRPIDYTSLDYVDQQQVYNENGSMSSQKESALGSEIYLIASGATAGKVFEVQAVLNYEAIPLQNAIDLFQVKPSKSDPIGFSQAMNAIQEIPTVEAQSASIYGLHEDLQIPSINQSTVNHAPADESPSITEQIFDFIAEPLGEAFGPVKFLAPFAKRGLKKLGLM